MEFTCPCCQKSVTEADVAKTIELLKLNDCWHEVTPEEPLIFTLPDYKWACDDCLSNKKAVLADISKQNYARRVVEAKKPFHLAYTPLKLVCRQCKKTFTVSSAQQRRSYENARVSIRVVPVTCFGCQAKLDISLEEKKALNLKLTEPISEKNLMKLIEHSKAVNDLENMKKYQLTLDKIRAPKFEHLRKKIAELTQNGEPTDVRLLIKLADYYQKLEEVETAQKYRILIKKLQKQWWEENVKPNLVAESKPEPKRTPINNAPIKLPPVLEKKLNGKETPLKKAKKKRIVKPFVEPQNLESEVEPADDGFFYGFWDE